MDTPVFAQLKSISLMPILYPRQYYSHPITQNHWIIMGNLGNNVQRKSGELGTHPAMAVQNHYPLHVGCLASTSSPTRTGSRSAGRRERARSWRRRLAPASGDTLFRLGCGSAAQTRKGDVTDAVVWCDHRRLGRRGPTVVQIHRRVLRKRICCGGGPIPAPP
jgi:hypothetical protein